MTEPVSTTIFYPGFNDPVMDGQKVFRIMLEALSRPGRVKDIPCRPDVPAPLYPSTAALALTLFDLDTFLWLDSTLDRPEIRQYLGFHCGSPLVKDPARASFGIFGQGNDFSGLAGFAQGDPAYPDRSSTLLIQVDGFDGPIVRTLGGPGIDGRTTLRVSGLPDTFWSEFKNNHQRFPQGVDCFLVSPLQVCGLPRTTRVEG